MAPRIPKDPDASAKVVKGARRMRSREATEIESENGSEDSESSAADEDLDDVEEQEYHTEDSEDDEVDEDEEVVERARPTGPYLPAHLLQPLPSPAYSGLDALPLAREQMSRKQKHSLRSRSRQSKKRQYDRMREEANATGSLAAGRAAQAKRGIVPASKRVVNGRVGKTGKVRVSGRQRLLAQRKRLAEQKEEDATRPFKKAKTQIKR